ncbi:DapH/DapD/GlmU-related protein [Marivirga arenosa]|uniref:DapH/DapD/GlmU-related protein n=1 Tax=Marivirga arenosa TaxID=3059076 RepID=A0AA49GBL1_9BACT|nr:DapH/DapD/GlmU-related protein [Marivirga sp. BKB1-2]WKK78959.2 DapH/DapD/GlmU-related protein [Marivirga sp. BKB1-2]
MLKLKDIISEIKYSSFIGAEETRIEKLAPAKDFQNFTSATLCWVSKKHEAIISDIKSGSIICGQDVDSSLLKDNCNYILVKDPRNTFSEIINKFFKKQDPVGISKSAKIEEDVQVGQNVWLGENVVIESGCIIGDNVKISHNSVIKSETIIEENVTIGSNTTIGGVGFGYEKDEKGFFYLINHIGNVVLKRNVEIGNNVCIDRAVLGSTLLGENVKVDNLVHIAHGVDIGENSVVIANAMVAGSVEIGANTWVAPSSSILNGLKIGSDTLIGIGAVVRKNVEDSDIIVGNPGKSIKRK